MSRPKVCPVSSLPWRHSVEQVLGVIHINSRETVSQASSPPSSSGSMRGLMEAYSRPRLLSILVEAAAADPALRALLGTAADASPSHQRLFTKPTWLSHDLHVNAYVPFILKRFQYLHATINSWAHILQTRGNQGVSLLYVILQTVQKRGPCYLVLA